MKSIDLVVEDAVQEYVARKVIAERGTGVTIDRVPGLHGAGYVDKNLGRFAKAAVHHPFLILRDLDSAECAPGFAQELPPESAPAGLVFCIAIREVEAWLIADSEGEKT